MNPSHQYRAAAISVFVQIERKIANLTSEQLLNLSRLDDVEEEDEDEVSAPEAEPVAVAITVLYASLYP